MSACNNDDVCEFTSVAMGPLFPSVVTSHPTTSTIWFKLKALTDESHPEKNSNIGNSSLNPMEKQALVFTELIRELCMSPMDTMSAVVPSLHALQQCLRSGWRPTNIAEVCFQFLQTLYDYLKDQTMVAFSLLNAGGPQCFHHPTRR